MLFYRVSFFGCTQRRTFPIRSLSKSCPGKINTKTEAIHTFVLSNRCDKLSLPIKRGKKKEMNKNEKENEKTS